MDQSLERDLEQRTNQLHGKQQNIEANLEEFSKDLFKIFNSLIEYLFEDKEIDERFLHKFEILSILKGNLDPINQYVDEIAYKNLDYKLQDHSDPAIGKLLKVQQLGTQYLTFLLEFNKKKVELNKEYIQYESQNALKLREFKKKQEEKIKELKRKNDHADYMLSVFEEKVKKQRLMNKSNK